MKRIMLGFAVLLPASALLAQETGNVKVQIDQLKGQLDNVVAAQGGFSTFEFVSSAMVAGKSVKGAPYSAEAVNETTQVLADGNRIVRRNSTKLYRDSEGRERREESVSRPGASQAEPARTVFITDPVASFSATLDTNKRTAHKMPMSNRVMLSPSAVAVGGTRGGGGMGGATAGVILPRTAAGPTPAHAGEHAVETYTVHSTGVGPAVATITTTPTGGGRGVVRTSGDQPAPKIEQLGKQMFDGVEAEGTRTTVTIPAGSPLGNERPIEIVSENWYSKELQMTVMSKRSDPRSGETIYRLTGITRNEPLRSLFEIPPGYEVTEPQMRQRKEEL